MTCGSCGAELGGTEKFCASCGTPTGVVAKAPGSAPGSAPNAPGSAPGSAPKAPGSAPGSTPRLSEKNADVNPYAETAAPRSDSSAPSAPKVSPLAVSAGVDGPTPFSEALAKVRKAKPKKPGTQMMTNAPALPPGAAEKKKPIAKTVAMPPPAKVAPPSSRSGAPAPISSPVASAKPQSEPRGMPQSIAPGRVPPSEPRGMPQSIAPARMPQSMAPGPMPMRAPPAFGAPPRAYPAQPYGGHPPAFPNYGFAYQPGARVHVTWSNGQRYPATVTQVTGTQCLVVFPDGQHHWVEMQYLTPG